MWKANGKTNTLLHFLGSLFPKTEKKCKIFPLEVKRSGGRLFRHSGLQGEEGGVFLKEMPRKKIYSKKDYKEKRKEHHCYENGTWNVRTLNEVAN
jgi:hypothetical protein